MKITINNNSQCQRVWDETQSEIESLVSRAEQNPERVLLYAHLRKLMSIAQMQQLMLWYLLTNKEDD